MQTRPTTRPSAGRFVRASCPARTEPVLRARAVRVFDVLYAKGKDNPAQNLLHKPLIARKKTLRHVFKEVPTRLECAYEVKGKTAEDIKTSLTKVLEERWATARRRRSGRA